MNVTLLRKSIFEHIIKLRSYWIRVALIPMSDVLKEERNLDMEETREGRPCNNKSRDWSDVAESQGGLRIATNPQKLRRGREGFFFRAFRGSNLISGLQAPEL